MYHGKAHDEFKIECRLYEQDRYGDFHWSGPAVSHPERVNYVTVSTIFGWKSVLTISDLYGSDAGIYFCNYVEEGEDVMAATFKLNVTGKLVLTPIELFSNCNHYLLQLTHISKIFL